MLKATDHFQLTLKTIFPAIDIFYEFLNNSLNQATLYLNDNSVQDAYKLIKVTKDLVAPLLRNIYDMVINSSSSPLDIFEFIKKIPESDSKIIEKVTIIELCELESKGQNITRYNTLVDIGVDVALIESNDYWKILGEESILRT